MTTNKLYWTYQRFREKIERDLDLEINDEEEAFISNTEFLGYYNDAIDKAEQIVMSLDQDYFLTRSTVSFVADTEEYDLPSDIYAQKIRRFLYRKSTDVHTISRVRDWRKFEEYEINLESGSSRIYRYFLINTTPGQPKLLITPVPNETGNYGKIWYIRQANRAENDADICDIPEANNFINAYLKLRCLLKESNPLAGEAKADYIQERQDLMDTLQDKTPDADNEIEMDMTSYEEHV